MRYAVFTDVHANLEALEAVLAKIDELAEHEPIDQIWFLGDLVGYGPNPNECIDLLRQRTDVIIAGNHDWAAVGKIDLEDFSAAARTSAEWTAEQLTEEHREFLTNLPEHIYLKECTLVHGSPYGPLWEYLTSEVLAERSFQHFTSRYCFVGHTHVPVIFLQPDTIEQTPTVPLGEAEHRDLASNDTEFELLDEDDDEETHKVVAVRPTQLTSKEASTPESVVSETTYPAPDTKEQSESTETIHKATPLTELRDTLELSVANSKPAGEEGVILNVVDGKHSNVEVDTIVSDPAVIEDDAEENQHKATSNGHKREEKTQKEHISDAEDRLNSEIEELLELLGLSQSMVQVTNEMLVPPEGAWSAPKGYRAIINPGGVGQPRDGDPRAAFMIYDTNKGFTFYRIHYDYEKTQEKIIKAGLPPYLAARLGYGR